MSKRKRRHFAPRWQKDNYRAAVLSQKLDAETIPHLASASGISQEPPPDVPDWETFHREDAARRAGNRERNLFAVEAAMEEAAAGGLRLEMHTDVHFSLIATDWRLEVYPGNQRLYRPAKHGRAPFFDLPDPWTVLDVVRAALNTPSLPGIPLPTRP